MPLLLVPCPVGINFGIERYASVDCCAALALRLDREFAINHLQPFLHDRKAEARSSQSLLRIKADSRIPYPQVDFIRSIA
jgi:hypothetical protein